jgi:hypothetical protein
MLTAVVVAVPFGAIAQPLVCRPVSPGESAASLARRLTGEAATAYSERFQIRDPSHPGFVPKSQYRRLRAGWQVCVAQDMIVTPGAHRFSTNSISTVGVTAIRPGVVESRPGARPRYDIVGAVHIAIATALVLLTSTVAIRFVRPTAAPRDLQHAGERFVSAFARPLIDPGSGVPPIMMRLHFVRRSQELEIYLAPTGERRYPNLLDHKRNVEYDVRRVLQLLGPRVVVSHPVRAENKWVVVSIRLIDPKEAGV